MKTFITFFILAFAVSGVCFAQASAGTSYANDKNSTPTYGNAAMTNSTNAAND